MIWERLKWSGQDGTIAEVYIDQSKTVIKKIFKEDGVTISGKKTKYPAEVVNACFKNEVEWSDTLRGRWLPELLEVHQSKQIIIQEYCGPDLLTYHMNNTLHKRIPDIVEQVTKMHEFFKQHNCYKINSSLSNMGLKNNKVIAFDFKWAQKAPLNTFWKKKEIECYHEYISKIDKTLPNILESMI